jgi:hypothetical protein
MEGWNLARYVNITLVDAQKFKDVVNSQRKLITIEKVFLDVSKQMLETSYTLNLAQLLKIALKLKRYFW